MRILIATDAWEPQVNGVVRTYQRIGEELVELGHEIVFITPNDYFTFPCPTYPEIRLAVVGAKTLARQLKAYGPNIVHVATEGPIGWAARRACLRAKIPFTTAYHTRFPEYVAERAPVPLAWLYKVMRLFHNAGSGVMVATSSLRDELEGRGFQQIVPWTRGVNMKLFHPRECRKFGAGPVAIYVGRVSVEKNLEAFLDLRFEGVKVVVGDGPSFEMLKEKYPAVIFTGALVGEQLAECYSSADVFVFPSLTDTFGIVMLEAMASGVPVAAFPVTGPIDVIEDGVTGALDEDLGVSVQRALTLDGDVCRERAERFSWRAAAEMFLQNAVISKN